MSRFDLYLVKYYYEDNPNKYKLRPVVMIGEVDNDAILAKITTHNPRQNFTREIIIDDYHVAGLNKPSTIRLNKTAFVPKSELIKQTRIGSLSERDINKLRRYLRENLYENSIN